MNHPIGIECLWDVHKWSQWLMLIWQFLEHGGSNTKPSKRLIIVYGAGQDSTNHNVDFRQCFCMKNNLLMQVMNILRSPKCVWLPQVVWPQAYELYLSGAKGMFPIHDMDYLINSVLINQPTTFCQPDRRQIPCINIRPLKFSWQMVAGQPMTAEVTKET